MTEFMSLDYENVSNIVKEVTGEETDEERRYSTTVNGVLFRIMYHRGTPSGMELSIHDVDWKKTFRRIRSVGGQISIGRLKTSYEELRKEYDEEIQPKKLESKRRDDKVQGLNGIAGSLKDASVTVYHDSSLHRGFSITVEGGEDLIEDCLSFLEKRCGRKEAIDV
jgi:hypothetical protein